MEARRLGTALCTMALSLLLLAALLSQVVAECGDHAAVASLDEEKLLGVWYITKQTTLNLPGRGHLKCPHIVYSRHGDDELDSVVALYNTSSSSYVTFNSHLHKATAGSTDGKYVGHREGQHSGRSFKLHIVHLEDTYAVGWTCTKKPNSEEIFEVIYLITREKQPSDSVVEEASTYMSAGNYSTPDQTDCPVHERHG